MYYMCQYINLNKQITFYRRKQKQSEGGVGTGWAAKVYNHCILYLTDDKQKSLQTEVVAAERRRRRRTPYTQVDLFIPSEESIYTYLPSN